MHDCYSTAVRTRRVVGLAGVAVLWNELFRHGATDPAALVPNLTATSAWPLALALQRCPRCRRGDLFAGIIAMHRTCPVCRLDLEPEVGYYTGAMVVSYVLSIPLLTLVAVVVGLITRWDLGPVIVSASFLYLALVVPLFRYARSIWLYLDWWLNPGSFRTS